MVLIFIDTAWISKLFHKKKEFSDSLDSSC